eukprot:scaffold182932_cov11-Tisochrysis_lutea.AAC.1
MRAASPARHAPPPCCSMRGKAKPSASCSIRRPSDSGRACRSCVPWLLTLLLLLPWLLVGAAAYMASDHSARASSEQGIATTAP